MHGVSHRHDDGGGEPDDGPAQHDVRGGAEARQHAHGRLRGLPRDAGRRSHINGTFVADSASNTDRFITRAATTWTDAAANSGTCSGTGINAASGCHTDNGDWARLWSTAANSTSTAEGDTRCNVCHGQLNNWRAGMVDGAQPHHHQRGHVARRVHAVPRLRRRELHVGDAPSERVDHDELGRDLLVQRDELRLLHGLPRQRRHPPVGRIRAGTVQLVDGPAATCNSCHGDRSGGTHYYPDSVPTGSGGNGTVWPNRAGRHSAHVTRIAAVRGLSTADSTTCSACHPAGAHTGDQAASPANLMNGTATHFLNIRGAADSGDSVTQSGTDVTCAGVNCHYNKTPPAADWYNTSVATCEYCHEYQSPIAAGALPYHDKHVLSRAQGGYDIQAMGCTICHDNTFGTDHQDGVVNFDADGAGYTPFDGNERMNGVVLTSYNGTVKYGAGVQADYPTCTAFYCHGDRPGGNAANAPNWFRTDEKIGAGLGDGRCGTCHGDPAGADPVAKAYPRTGIFAESHAEHIVSNSQPGCSACHEHSQIDGNGGIVGLGTFGATTGDYLHVETISST